MEKPISYILLLVLAYILFGAQMASYVTDSTGVLWTVVKNLRRNSLGRHGR